MRNPLGKAGLFLGVGVSGAALVWLGDTVYDARGETWASMVPIVLGSMMLMVGVAFLLQSLVYALGYARLIAGKDVIARWQVDAADWDRFRAFDRARASESAALVNDLWLRKETPAGGVDMIIGKTSMLVDGSYHVLRPGGQPAIRGVQVLASPDGLQCIEFAIAYGNKYGAVTNRLALRFPYPHGARHDVRRVLDHFQFITRPRTALAMRNPRRTINACLLVAGVCAAAAATGYAMNANQQDGNLPVMLAVGGTIFGSGALLLAGLVALLQSRKKTGL